MLEDMFSFNKSVRKLTVIVYILLWDKLSYSNLLLILVKSIASILLLLRYKYFNLRKYYKLYTILKPLPLLSIH